MRVKEIGLSWIVIKDLQAAIDYYTQVVGLQLVEVHKEYGWAELVGYEGGSRLGLAQENPQEAVKAGQNAVMTFTVEDLEKTKVAMVKKGARCEGNIIEIPGHVKLQTVVDQDGNRFQLCQFLPPSLHD